MKKLPLLILLSAMLSVSACTTRNTSNVPNEEEPETIVDDDTDPGTDTDPDVDPDPIDDDEEVDDCPIDHISLNKSTLDLVVGKFEYLSVYFYPDNETTENLHDGVWSIADENIATISNHGKVEAKKVGQTVAYFTTNSGNRRASCAVYVFESAESIVRKYVKVADADSIKPGDQIVFASPELGVAASLERTSGYLKTTPTSFSSDKSTITSLGENAGEYIVGEGTDDSLTLESQKNKYLAGKSSDYNNSLVFLPSYKGSVDWIFEIPDGYSKIFCVNYDLYDDLWLMFNKINDSDIRFNLYDSNETQLMILPTIYRLTIIK